MKKIIISLLILFIFIFSLTHLVNLSFADNNIIYSSHNVQLTKEEAKAILIRHNNTVDYIYQGDAQQYPTLKSKRLEGYVFLPNAPTDIGYFVDKNNCEIYYFHPSGYLEHIPF